MTRACSFLDSIVSLHLPSIRDRLDLCNVIQGTTSPSNSNQFLFKGSEFAKLKCHPDNCVAFGLSFSICLEGRTLQSKGSACLSFPGARGPCQHLRGPWCHFPEIMIFDHKHEVPVMHAQICQSQSPCLLFRFMTRITIGLPNDLLLKP